MSCGLHDSLELEARGLPVAMLATDAFRRSVAEQLEAIAFTAFEPIYLPHPIASLPPDAVHRKADAALAEIVARLTGTAPIDARTQTAEITARPAPKFAVSLPAPTVAGADSDTDCEECTIDAAERGLP